MSRCLSWMAAAGMMAFGAQSASWIVWPGQSIQSTVNTAAASDDITLKEGIYTENVTLNKGLDIRGESGKKSSTILNGCLTITGTTVPVYLAGFTIGAAARSNLTVSACSDVRMDNMACGSLSVSGSKFYLYQSTSYGATFSSASDWTAQRTTFSGNLTSTNSPTKLLASTVTGSLTHSTRSRDCTIFQSVIASQLTSVTADNYWIGYNRLNRLSLTGTGVCEVVGNRIYMIETNNVISLNVSSPVIRNNVIVMENSSSLASDYTCIAVGVNSPVIVNNTIYVTVYGKGVSATAGSQARLVNNFVSQYYSRPCVDAPSTVELRYCYLSTYYCHYETSYTSGGVSPVNCITSDSRPSFLNTSNQTSANYYRVSGTTYNDAGDPDPQYNDLDNTRNMLGVWGGHAYDPQGLITTTPVVIWADASPLYIKRGDVIRLRARGAVRAQ